MSQTKRPKQDLVSQKKINKIKIKKDNQFKKATYATFFSTNGPAIQQQKNVVVHPYLL
jgi:hypothetical protein